MKSIILFSLLTLLTGSPLLSLAVIIIIYVFIDRSFIGLLPDFTANWRRSARARELEKTVRANPHNGDALLELGIFYFDRKNYGRAVNLLEKAYEKMKDWPEVHYYLGAAYYETGTAEKGLAEIRRSAEMNPRILYGFPYIYMIRALLENRTGGGETGELENSLIRYGSVQAFYEAGKLFNSHGREISSAKFFREVLENYRLASPTLRRSYRKMAMLSRLRLK